MLSKKNSFQYTAGRYQNYLINIEWDIKRISNIFMRVKSSNPKNLIRAPIQGRYNDKKSKRHGGVLTVT